MTISLNLANIADAISAISISGVTVKDKDQITPSWVSQPNVLYPNPDEWITDFAMQWDSFTQGAEYPATVTYTLHYRFLGVQVGDMSTFAASYSALVDKVALIANAFMVLPAPYNGGIELKLGSVTLGPTMDPAGNQFFGADFALFISELQN